jgi:hypothetical protein
VNTIIIDTNKTLNEDLLACLCKLNLSFLVISGNLLVTKIIDEHLLQTAKELILKYHGNDNISIFEFSIKETLENIAETYITDKMKSEFINTGE